MDDDASEASIREEIPHGQAGIFGDGMARKSEAFALAWMEDNRRSDRVLWQPAKSIRLVSALLAS